MKTRSLSGFAAVALAWALGCSGSAAPSFRALTTRDGGAADGGGLTGTDARARDASAGLEGDGADRTTSTAPSSTSNQYCCAGAWFYACPNAAAVAQCSSACTRDPSNDATCANVSGNSGNPGSAANTGSAGNSGSAGSGAPAPPTNPCGGFYPGMACEVGGGCIVGHCTGNACYPNDVGNPCTFAIDCGDGNHCTAGCCASPATGSACDAPWDCKSGTCTNAVCQ